MMMLMTVNSLDSAAEMETLDLLHQFYLAQAFVTVIATSSGALLRSAFKLFKLGHLEN